MLCPIRRSNYPKKFVPYANARLNGVRNGRRIGKRLNIVVNDVGIANNYKLTVNSEMWKTGDLPTVPVANAENPMLEAEN